MGWKGFEDRQSDPHANTKGDLDAPPSAGHKTPNEKHLDDHDLLLNDMLHLYFFFFPNLKAIKSARKVL